MADEPFDIGKLIPPTVKRVNLLIRLKRSSVYIGVSSADEAKGPGRVLGGATLWREGGGPVLIAVPANLQIAVIDTDANTG